MIQTSIGTGVYLQLSAWYRKKQCTISSKYAYKYNQDKHKDNQELVQEIHKIYSGSTTYAFLHCSKQEALSSLLCKTTINFLLIDREEPFTKGWYGVLIVITSSGISSSKTKSLNASSGLTRS